MGGAERGATCIVVVVCATWVQLINHFNTRRRREKRGSRRGREGRRRGGGGDSFKVG